MMPRRKATAPPECKRPAPGPSFPGLERGDEVVHIPMSWLVEGAFPSYTTSILMGRKGRGKSMIAVALTAQLTAGVPFPGYTGPSFGRVLWACREASFGGEIGPRLVLNGAHSSHYYRIHPIRPDGNKRFLNFFDDIEELRNIVRRVEVRLLVLDPIDVIVPRSFNLNDPQLARDYMEVMNEFCSEERLTIIGMLHMNKRSKGELTSAGYFSEQLVNACRSVLRCDRHPHEKKTFVLSKVVGNTGGGFNGLCYRFEGEPKGHPRIIWTGSTDLDIEAIVEGSGSLAEIEEWKEAEVLLYLSLQQGARLANDLRKEAELAGIAWVACRRAKPRLGIVSRFKHAGGKTHWQWEPPETWPPGLKEAAEGVSAEGERLERLEHLTNDHPPKNTGKSVRRSRRSPPTPPPPDPQGAHSSEEVNHGEKAD